MFKVLRFEAVPCLNSLNRRVERHVNIGLKPAGQEDREFFDLVVVAGRGQLGFPSDAGGGTSRVERRKRRERENHGFP